VSTPAEEYEGESKQNYNADHWANDFGQSGRLGRGRWTVVTEARDDFEIPIAVTVARDADLQALN
jgi:hypothetical protein